MNKRGQGRYHVVTNAERLKYPKIIGVMVENILISLKLSDSVIPNFFITMKLKKGNGKRKEVRRKYTSTGKKKNTCLDCSGDMASADMIDNFKVLK